MICVIDYGVGNIGSVMNMIRKMGGHAFSTSDPSLIRTSNKLLLPGVGSFDNAMNRLSQLNLVQPILDSVAEGKFLFGICLGMQLLSDRSEEGTLPGLGLIPGQVCRFQFDRSVTDYLKVPHMGWNQVTVKKEHKLNNDLQIGARFYFVHSYHYVCSEQDDVLFETHYGYDFASGIQKANVMGVQFHPEKSHRFGMQLIKNFIEL